VPHRAQLGAGREFDRGFARPDGDERPREGLGDEIGPLVGGVRAGYTEPADTDDDQGGEPLGQKVPLGAEVGQVPPVRGLDDQVGSLKQPPQPIAIPRDGRVGDHPFLVEVQVGEGARVGPQFVARRTFHLHHLGAEVGEHLAAVAPGHAFGQLHHHEVTQQLAHPTLLLNQIQFSGGPGSESRSSFRRTLTRCG
jgi:hypothetical protein